MAKAPVKSACSRNTSTCRIRGIFLNNSKAKTKAATSWTTTSTTATTPTRSNRSSMCISLKCSLRAICGRASSYSLAWFQWSCACLLQCRCFWIKRYAMHIPVKSLLWLVWVNSSPAGAWWSGNSAQSTTYATLKATNFTLWLSNYGWRLIGGILLINPILIAAAKNGKDTVWIN